MIVVVSNTSPLTNLAAIGHCVAQQTEGKMRDWQLGRSCKNQIGVTKAKHLSSDARVRVGGGCFFAFTDEVLTHVHNDAGNGRARRRARPFVYSLDIR